MYLGPRFKIKKESHQTSKDLFSQESNWRMEELFLITTSKRNLLSTWFWDLEVVVREVWKLNQLLQNSLESLNKTRWFAENAMLHSHQKLPIAERESVAITVTSDPRRSQIEQSCPSSNEIHQEILQYVVFKSKENLTKYYTLIH